MPGTALDSVALLDYEGADLAERERWRLERGYGLPDRQPPATSMPDFVFVGVEVLSRWIWDGVIYVLYPPGGELEQTVAEGLGLIP